jgi:hypothetical protein
MEFSLINLHYVAAQQSYLMEKRKTANPAKKLQLYQGLSLLAWLMVNATFNMATLCGFFWIFSKGRFRKNVA